MTVDPADSSVWTYTWNTAGLLPNTYIALIEMQLDGGAKVAPFGVVLRPTTIVNPFAFVDDVMPGT